MTYILHSNKNPTIHQPVDYNLIYNEFLQQNDYKEKDEINWLKFDELMFYEEFGEDIINKIRFNFKHSYLYKNLGEDKVLIQLNNYSSIEDLILIRREGIINVRYVLMYLFKHNYLEKPYHKSKICKFDEVIDHLIYKFNWGD